MPQLLVLEDRTVLSVLTVLNNGDSGAGSLRDTLAAAQSGDTIIFDPSLDYQTITLSSGLLALSSNLTIDGPGASLLTISGENASQLFTLSGSTQVTLANLTLTGGVSSQGGAVFIGGSAALTLNNDVLSGNQAVGDANGNALGGAVYNSAGASLTINNTWFVNNQTNGAMNSFGGALANAGSLVITGATFTGNTALGSTANTFGPLPGGSQGGAIGNLYGSSATITLSTFAANQALGSSAGQGDGGAVCDGGGGSSPVTVVACTVSRCTFANNTSKGGLMNPSGFSYYYGGGAIEAGPGTNLTILSCSFTGNQVDNSGNANAAGGAIDASAGVTTTISDSQFIGNAAIASIVGATAVGGALDNFATMTIDSSLFTGNRAVGGPMADGVNNLGQAWGGAILTGNLSGNGVPVILTISHSMVAGNDAIGGSGESTLATPFCGAAYGGGILNYAGTLNVAGCTITGNQAVGGASAQGRGGPALGGGIRNRSWKNSRGVLNLTNSTVSTNLSQGGAGASGAAGGVASGGAINNDLTATAILTDSILSFNESIGGAGGAGVNGGAALGGGITNADEHFAFGNTDASSLVVSNCQIIGNVAQGGTADSSAQGGDGLGGGLFAGGGTMVLQAVLVSSNQAQGGTDSQGNITGQGLGGGVSVDPSASATADMATYIAGNQASKSNNDVWGTLTIGP